MKAPTEQTHKTICVNATMVTDLELHINVPIDISDDEIQEFINNGNIDGGDLQEAGYGSGDWTWEESTDAEFDVDAEDYTEALNREGVQS